MSQGSRDGPPEEAALLAGVSLRDICRRVGADDMHFVETANGGLFASIRF
ncbi:MAG: hypothetical protein M3410_05260 [Acidobacteriota bacterium]|nr:hypothetical protein [Acidobacteriota bacterium]